jgi:hypothetical protein
MQAHISRVRLSAQLCKREWKEISNNNFGARLAEEAKRQRGQMHRRPRRDNPKPTCNHELESD